MQAELDKEDIASKISVVIASGMHFDQSTSESLDAEPHSVLTAVSREGGNIGSAQASPAYATETAAAWDRLSHESRLRQQEVVLQSCSTTAVTEANEMAGLQVGDYVIRRGELHTVIAIDHSLSPIACTVQNNTTGAVVATELPFLSIPKREHLSAERHSVLAAVSRECDNIGSAQATPAYAVEATAAWDRPSVGSEQFRPLHCANDAAQNNQMLGKCSGHCLGGPLPFSSPRPQTDAAWDRISPESRLRRKILLEQKAKRESINIPTADRSIALQNMLRVHAEGASIHHITKINGCPATLVDPGAQVSASSDFDLEECITVIDPTDRVDLKSFSGNREQLLCLGSTTKQKISQTTTGALTVFVWKEYLLKTNTSINIMSIHELEAAGGSAHFGTNDELRITQTVAGTTHE